MSSREDKILIQEQNSKVKGIVASNEDDSVKIDQIAKARQWFRPGDQNPFYPVIQEYVNGKIDLAGATRKLFDPIDQKISANKVDEVNFYDLWLSVIHSAKRISFRDADKQAKVVALVDACKNHSVPGNEKHNNLFSSLTDFGMACRGALNDSPARSAEETEIYANEIDAWANINFFFAQITTKEIQDLSLYAIWAMRDALEDVQPPQKLDMLVPAAATWVFGMGKSLYQKEKDLTPSGSGGNPAKGGELWKGKSEFSKERWALWKNRFAEIGNNKDVNQKTSAIAKDAVQAMERSETFETVR